MELLHTTSEYESAVPQLKYVHGANGKAVSQFPCKARPDCTATVRLNFGCACMTHINSHMKAP
jgi:hypothetical protein